MTPYTQLRDIINDAVADTKLNDYQKLQLLYGWEKRLNGLLQQSEFNPDTTFDICALIAYIKLNINQILHSDVPSV